MAGWSVWKSASTIAKRELRFRYAILIINCLICLMGIITVGVCAGIYVTQSKEIFEYAETAANPPVLGVGVGCLLLFSSATIGFLAAIKFQSRFLNMYWCVLILNCVVTLLVGFLTILFFGAKDNVEVFVDKFQAGIYNYGEDAVSTNFMNKAQEDLNCCGIESFMDWNMNKAFSCDFNSNATESFTNTSCSVPESCCIKEFDGCAKGVLNSSSTWENINQNGCISEVTDIIQDNANAVGAVSFVDFAFVLANTVILSLYIFRRQRKFSEVAQTGD